MSSQRSRKALLGRWFVQCEPLADERLHGDDEASKAPVRISRPSIQALERAQGYLKLPNGRALTGHSHDYKRHGTTTLFAAFEVATGKVTGAHKKRRRRKEFLAFMDEVVGPIPRPGSRSSSII